MTNDEVIDATSETLIDLTNFDYAGARRSAIKRIPLMRSCDISDAEALAMRTDWLHPFESIQRHDDKIVCVAGDALSASDLARCMALQLKNNGAVHVLENLEIAVEACEQYGAEIVRKNLVFTYRPKRS